MNLRICIHGWLLSGLLAGLFSLLAEAKAGAAQSVTLTLGSTNGVAGAQVLVPIKVTQFTNISVFQFSLHWTQTVAMYMGVEQFGVPGLAGGNFGTTHTNTGTLTVSWDDPDGTSKSLTNGSALFWLRFQLAGTNGASSAVTIDSTPTYLEVDNALLQQLPVTVVQGLITVGSAPPDTNTPPITITSPTAATTYATSSSTINMAGTASDKFAFTQVVWSNDRGGSGIASGITNWSASGVGLQEGTNVIMILAVNPGGQSYADSLQVTKSGATLLISRTGNNLLVRWPSSLSGFHLEGKNALGQGTWSQEGTPVQSNGFFNVTISPSNSSRFLRLAQP